MRRHASRHATPRENPDAIGNLDAHGAELVVRGVADRSIDPYATSGYPQPAAQTIATWPYTPTPALADLVADQLTPGLADRTGWSLFQWLQDRHLIPALGVIVGDVCGWGAAATEPNHPWFGSVFLGFGIVAGLAYGAIHVIRAINGDDGAPIPRGAHAIGLLGVTLTSFGIACITGMSWLSVGISALLPGGIGQWAWFENRHSRLQDQRGYLVEQTAAATPTIVPMPGGNAAAAPAVIPGQVLSHEEQLVRRAFQGDGVSKGMGIQLADIHSFARIDADSWSVTVVLAPAAGVSPESVIARRDVLCSALGANQVIALPTRRGHELRITARFGDIDPLAETIPFPGPVATSITQPLPIAEAADGSKGELLLLGTHSLIGGATNGGKSVILKVLVISIAALRDAVLWLWDLKPGRIELGIFEKVADRSAKDLADAALMLEALLAIADERGAILAELREKNNELVEKWDPTVHGPVIVAVFDEFAELVRLAKKVRKGQYSEPVMAAIKFIASNFETCVQVFRALGIQIVIATQSPSSAITSGQGKDGLDQIQNLVCVQTAKISQTNIILGQGAHGDGYRAHTDLYVSGMCYFRTPKIRTPVKHKSYWVENDEIVAYADELSPTRPPLDERSAVRADEVLGEHGMTPITTPPPGGGPGRRPVDGVADARPAARTLRLVPLYPDGTEIDEKHRALWDLLDTFGQGATVSELARAAQAAGHESCSLAWVRDRCKEWRTAGVVGFGVEGRDYRYWRDDESVQRRRRREA